jgi:hypothetical protein
VPKTRAWRRKKVMMHTRVWSKKRTWWYCFDGAMVVCDGVVACVVMVLLCLSE